MTGFFCTPVKTLQLPAAMYYIGVFEYVGKYLRRLICLKKWLQNTAATCQAQAACARAQEAVGTIAEERSDNASLRSKLESLEALTSRQAEKRGVEMDRLLSQVLL